MQPITTRRAPNHRDPRREAFHGVQERATAHQSAHPLVTTPDGESGDQSRVPIGSPRSLAVSFLLALRASGRSDRTAWTYQQALDQLQRFSRETGMPPPEAMSAEHLREFLLSLYQRGNRPGTVANRYGALRAFYKWLVEEGERRDNPLDRISAPKVEEKVQPHYTPDEIAALLVACHGRDTLDLRDTAIILTLYDTGIRGQELCDLTLDALDLKALTLRVRGKGQKERVVGLGYKAAKAVDKYLRRQSHPDSPYLYLNRSGAPLQFNSLRLMLERRFRQAGLRFRGVHAFRRAFAISYLATGGSAEDLRVLAGWDSPQMLRRYTKATERERALTGHRQHSPADRLR